MGAAADEEDKEAAETLKKQLKDFKPAKIKKIMKALAKFEKEKIAQKLKPKPRFCKECPKCMEFVRQQKQRSIFNLKQAKCDEAPLQIDCSMDLLTNLENREKKGLELNIKCAWVHNQPYYEGMYDKCKHCPICQAWSDDK